MLKSIILTCFFLYLVKAFPLQLCKLHINGVKSTSGNQACNQQRWCRRSGSKISLQKSSEDRESTSFINYCSPVATWGEGLSQADLMNKDECIVVDDRDQIIGHDSKYSVHRFDPKNPKGILHRAFSVFLFNQEGKLLLQKRASDKITFPSVWTNTCCSHPLYGYTPSEVDDEDSVNKGELFGIKSAAIRKLKHELGIEPEQVSSNAFKYLGRIHYCAADVSEAVPATSVMTNDVIDEGAWGEHEIDYILFIKATVDLKPNPEEVGEWKYVDYKELKDMMNQSIPEGAGLRWSPWFRHVVDSLLIDWWKDLDATLTTDVCVDLKNIHRF